MAKTRYEMATQVRLNLKRDTEGIPGSIVDDWVEWSQQRIADLHTFEEMNVRIYDPVIEDCEAAWDAEANVTCTADSTYVKFGTYSAKQAIADGHTTGLAATNVIASTDFTEYTHLKFWIRASVANAAGGLQIMLDDTATCASPLETLNVPVLVADTWKECTLKLSAPTSASAIISIGLNVATDVGAQDVYIDEVRMVRCTEKDVVRYSPPTDNKDILGITIQDGSSSRKLTAVHERTFDRAVPRAREATSDMPTHYIDYGKYFEVWPAPDTTYPMFIRYSKYPAAFSETSLVVENCEDAWVAKANVTSTADTAYVKLGSYSSKNVIAAAHTTGLASTEDFAAAVDVSGYTHLKLWMRTTVAVNAGDLQMVLDDTAACASPLETLDVPAMVADTWYEHTLAFVTPANLTAALSVGLNVAVDGGAMTVYIDDVRVVTTSESELIRKDRVIEAGATIYGFEYLRQYDDSKTWNQVFWNMMQESMKTDKNHADLTQIAQPFNGGGSTFPPGDYWSYPDYGR